MHECAVTFVNFGLQSLYDLYDGETLSDKPPAAIRQLLKVGAGGLQRIQRLIGLTLHARSGYLCPSSCIISATSASQALRW